ncbi:MAG: Wzz/FepE/Etk N-terminal domain-containing protein [Candidatus Brocadia sp.]|nr:Wzz/FepE/Etk N-terminal domain-containing protein [Candidatus Brocadia sp.]
MNANHPLISLRDYVKVLFRHKFAIIAVCVITMLGIFIGLELKTPIYSARVTMLISAQKQTESPYYTNLSGSQVQQLTPSGIVNSNPVIKRAVNALKLHERPPDYEKQFCSPLKARLIDFKLKRQESHNSSPVDEQTYRFRMAVEDLKGNIEVEPIRDTNLFAISVSDFSPEAAAKIANVVSRSYVIFDLEQQLAETRLQYGEKNPIVMQLKNTIDKMVHTLHGEILPDMEAIGPATVKIIEQAEVPLEPRGTNKRTTLLLGLIMSPFLGIIIAFGLEYIDHTIKSPQDITTYLNLPHLGSIPRNGFAKNGLMRDVKQGTASHQFYQRLSDNICLLIKERNIKSLLITASSPLERSSAVIANLGKFLSGKTGQTVIIIDANLKTQATNKTFNSSDVPGLSDVLERKIPLEDATQDISPHLTVLPAGDTLLEPALLLESARMGDVIKLAKEKYGLVLIDYSNLMNLRDTCILSSYLDGVILVVSEGKTKHHVLKELIESLSDKNVNLLGAVLNNRTFPIPKVIYKRI